MKRPEYLTRLVYKASSQGHGEHRKLVNQDNQIITLARARAAAATGTFTRIHDDGGAA